MFLFIHLFICLFHVLSLKLGSITIRCSENEHKLTPLLGEGSLTLPWVPEVFFLRAVGSPLAESRTLTEPRVAGPDGAPEIEPSLKYRISDNRYERDQET